MTAPTKSPIVRTPREIEVLQNTAIQEAENGTGYPGESYENGIVATLEWLTNEDAPYPFED